MRQDRQVREKAKAREAARNRRDNKAVIQTVLGEGNSGAGGLTVCAVY